MLVRLASKIARVKRSSSRPQWLMRFLELETDSDMDSAFEPHQFHRGLVMIQIDGLGREEFQCALTRGELPFLKQLIERQHYEVHSLYSGLPSSTPAVQGELFYGVKTAVPAFAFVDHKSHKLHRMVDPESAKAIEEKLTKLGRPLLQGGSAYSNIYTGGAKESHFCAASFGFGHSLKTFKPLARLGIGLIFLPTLIRTITLVAVELVLAIIDFFRGIASGHRVLPELKFILARVAICIGLRDVVSIGAQVDILRGLPIVHLNLLGYDEQSHRRGPHSAFAHWTLRGIDRCIKRLWQASIESPYRHYDLWIYSDHGQEATQPYTERSGQSLTDVLDTAMKTLDFSTMTGSIQSQAHAQIQPQLITSIRARFLGGRYLQKFIPSARNDSIGIHDRNYRLAAMGPVGHVYSTMFNDPLNRAAIATYMATTGQVPAVMYIDGDNEVVVQSSEALYRLPMQSTEFAGKTHPFAKMIGSDLVSLCHHQDSGQVIMLGWASHTSPVSFPIENGAHAGPGPLETHAFALLPADTKLTESTDSGLRPLDLRNAAISILDQDPELPTSNFFPRPRIMRGASTPIQLQRPSNQPTHHQNDSYTQQKFRLMTYNVHGCVGMDGRHTPERIARVIAHYEPDIVALQELDVNRSRSYKTDQVEIIARLMEMHYHFHPSMHIESGAYGNAILTYLPIKIVKAEQLPTHPSKENIEPRGAIWAAIDLGDRNLQLICTHLGLYPDERLRQIQMLQSKHWLDHEVFKEDPGILCGDFNATPGSAALRALDSCWRDVQQGYLARPTSNYKTFSSILPALRIDHVFTNANLNACAVQVPCFELARRASDHLPLVVDFDLNIAESVSAIDSQQ